MIIGASVSSLDHTGKMDKEKGLLIKGNLEKYNDSTALVPNK